MWLHISLYEGRESFYPKILPHVSCPTGDLAKRMNPEKRETETSTGDMENWVDTEPQSTRYSPYHRKAKSLPRNPPVKTPFWR